MSFKLGQIVQHLPAGLVAQFICPTGKQPFATKAAAQAALKKINPSQRHNMKSFRCNFCDQYHLGHRRGIY